MNGWTVKKMIAHIKKNFTGNSFKVSPGGDVSCLYRGPNGEKCAIGMFIKDKDYNENMEDNCASEVRRNNPNLKFPLASDAMDTLQSQHDRCCEDNISALPVMIKWIKENVTDGEKHV